MAPVVRSVASGGGTSTTSATTTKPAGTTTGDLLIAFATAVWTGTVTNITAPTGWTKQGPDQSVTDGTYSVQGRVFTRTATSTEPADYTFQAGTSRGGFAVSIVAVTTGTYDPAAPLAAAPTWSGQASTATSQPAPSVTPGVADTLLLCGWSSLIFSNATSYSPPAGMTEIVDYAPSGNQISQSLARQVLASGTATGTRTATNTRANYWIGLSAAVAPLSSISASPTAAAAGIVATATAPTGSVSLDRIPDPVMLAPTAPAPAWSRSASRDPQTAALDTAVPTALAAPNLANPAAVTARLDVGPPGSTGGPTYPSGALYPSGGLYPSGDGPVGATISTLTLTQTFPLLAALAAAAPAPAPTGVVHAGTAATVTVSAVDVTWSHPVPAGTAHAEPSTPPAEAAVLVAADATTAEADAAGVPGDVAVAVVAPAAAPAASGATAQPAATTVATRIGPAATTAAAAAAAPVTAVAAPALPAALTAAGLQAGNDVGTSGVVTAAVPVTAPAAGTDAVALGMVFPTAARTTITGRAATTDAGYTATAQPALVLIRGLGALIPRGNLALFNLDADATVLGVLDVADLSTTEIDGTITVAVLDAAVAADQLGVTVTAVATLDADADTRGT